jgi:protein-S-isoprenylcysteine O-methyltransferase Ste14
MTAGRFLFALAFTLYVLLAVHIEERDLVAEHPEYDDYRQQVPMLLPSPLGRRSRRSSEPVVGA